MSDIQNRDFAWQQVALPSKGLFYYGALPDGAVQVRAFTTEDELIFDNSTISATDRLQYIINNCMRLPPGFAYKIPDTDPAIEFKGAGGLLESDRAAALIAQRYISVGTKYKVSHRCPACKNPISKSVDLMQELRNRDIGDVEATAKKRGLPFPGKEPFEVQLDDARTVAVRLIRNVDMDYVQNRIRAYREEYPNAKYDPQRLVTRAHQIALVNGKPMEQRMKEQFVLRLDTSIRAKMERVLNTYDTGVTWTFPMDCPCGNQIGVSVLENPSEFFRAADQDDGTDSSGN